MPLLIALILAAIAASPATAQEPGVFVDPDSPAGKEYAVPLDEARREAAGAALRGARESASGQPLFGIGIDREARRTPAAVATRGTGSGAGAGAGGGPSPETIAPSGQSTAAIEAAASGGGGGLLTAGIAAAVLAAGLLGGFGLRRLLRES